MFAEGSMIAASERFSVVEFADGVCLVGWEPNEEDAWTFVSRVDCDDVEQLTAVVRYAFQIGRYGDADPTAPLDRLEVYPPLNPLDFQSI